MIDVYEKGLINVYEKGKQTISKIRHKDTWFHRLDHRFMISGWISALAVCAMSGIFLDVIVGSFVPDLVECLVHIGGCICVFHIYESKGWIKL